MNVVKKIIVFSMILSCSAFICMEKNHSMSSVLCYLSSIHKCCPRMWLYIHWSLLFLSTRKIKYYMKLRKQLASRTLSSATKKSIPLYKRVFLKIYIYSLYQRDEEKYISFEMFYFDFKNYLAFCIYIFSFNDWSKSWYN